MTLSSVIKGHLTGGNLTVFTHAIGTLLDPVIENKILLLEDVSEPGYKIRRCLTQLEQAGKIAKATAIILGDFIEGDENVDWAINDFIARNPLIPIFRAENVGHGQDNIPIVFGKDATIIGNVLEYQLE